MCRSLFLGGIEAGALQNDIDADLAPRKVLCVCFLIDGDSLAIDNDSVIGNFDSVLALAELACESALSGVILKPIRPNPLIATFTMILILLKMEFAVYIAIIDILLEHGSKCKNGVRTFTNSVLTQNVFRHILGMVGNTLQIVDDLDKDDAGSRVALSC